MTEARVNRNKAVVFVVFSQFFHKIGETIYDLAMPLLVLYATGSATLMGLMYALGFAAEFLVGLFGGSIVDNVDRKKLLIGISSSQAVVICSLPVANIFGFFNVYLIFVVAFILDALVSIYRIADISIVPQLVEKSQLPHVTGYMQMSLSTAEAVGPAVAGFSIAALGLFSSLWINSGAFLILLFTVLLVRQANLTSTTGEEISPKQMLTSSFEGLSYTMGNGLYRVLLIWNAVVNFGLGGAILIVIFYLKEGLNLTSFQIGIIMALGALGGISSGYAFSKLQALFSSGKLLLFSTLAISATLFSLALTSFWPLFGLLYGILMFNVALGSRLIHLLFQSSVPTELLGRVLAAEELTSSLLAPASVLLAGWVSDAYGAPPVFTGAALIIFISTLICFRTRMKDATWAIQKDVAK